MSLSKLCSRDLNICSKATKKSSALPIVLVCIYHIHFSIVKAFKILFLLPFSSGIPRFTLEPQSAVARSGSTVTLSCAVMQTDPPATVKWTLNGTVLVLQPPATAPGGVKQRRTYDIRDGILRIASFGISHEGIYQCVASNAHGVVTSAEARLEIACEFLGTDYFTNGCQESIE